MKKQLSEVCRFYFLLYIIFLFFGLFATTINCIAQDDSILKSLKEQALNAQKRMDRMSLDSIADLMIAASAGMGDAAYLNSAKYFKSDAITRKDPNLGIQYGEEALEYFKAKNDFYYLSRVNNVLGHSYSNIGEHLKAIEYYKASTENSKLLDNGNSREEIKYRSRVYYNSGFTLVRRGDLDAAMEYFTRAHTIAKEQNDTLVVMSILNQYGNINLYRKNYNEALVDFQKAFQIGEMSSLSHVLSPLLGIASIYQETGRTDSAIYFYHQIISEAKEINNISTLCVALTNCSELYIDIGAYDQGIEMAYELQKYARTLGVKQHDLNAAIALGRGLQHVNEHDEASKVISEAISKIDSEVEFDLAMHLYKIGSELAEKKNHLSKALLYHKSYKQYSDSLLNNQTLAKVDELQIKFESDQKDTQIQKLSVRNELNALAYKQRTTLLVALLIGLVLVGTIVYLFINRKRILLLRQKENIERRLLRSQMNPHFIFNAISSIQNYLYDKSDLKVALHYMSKFADLMRQILENSREDYVPLSEEIKSLENYLELQQLRYSNSFGYQIIIDDDLDINQIMVPPLIAQPFVENAIEHGMIYRIENGLVKISFTNNEDKIELLIEDNGVGAKSLKIAPKKIQHKKKSLATVITNERLELLSKINKSKFEMAISSLNEGGTLVSIQLPKILAA